MKEKILTHINYPKELENLYQSDKDEFEKVFSNLYPEISDKPIACFWYERLNYNTTPAVATKKWDLLFIFIGSIIAALIANIPAFITINQASFYLRNISFILFPVLIYYFLYKRKSSLKKIVGVSILLACSIVYINILPNLKNSNTFDLACVHLPFFIWSILGFSYIGDNYKDYKKSLDFLRYNANLLIITHIVSIVGGILFFLISGLFMITKISIPHTLIRYVVIWGICAFPIVGNYLLQFYPKLVHKVSPVIALFLIPVVFFILLAFLVIFVVVGENPYQDRGSLILLNSIVLFVIAVIFFSLGEQPTKTQKSVRPLMSLGLCILTIVINAIVLSAVLFRISEWGITPNRFVVLGSNILIFLHLLTITFHLFMSIKKNKEIELVEQSVVKFLPIYSVWVMVVVFVLPIIFGFN